ncbi:sporulation protein YunB [Halanaerobacter jeridensis]|uniref:Sporulation protein YunB n=1 Tax=Halanaerobacter jeridensis TaxID=706427 RepID=A0A938XP47_9FIRM|nr:sporulation protein YunB [Halanaerobacter jeridensis]MBM7556528.1 sporulation protein YunB [Halanaerobacter jeridensis]
MFWNLKRKLIVLFLILIVASSLMIVVIELTLQPILHSICQSKITAMLTKTINQAVNQQTKDITYSDLVMIKTNQQGQIILMQPNLQLINELSSQITLQLQQLLEQQKKQLIKIPLLRIFGIEIFSQYSPKLTVRIVPYGATTTNIIDDFEAVGINQSRHKLYLKIKTKVKVLLPLLGSDIGVITQVPLSEAVIVGQVPEVYVGVENGILKTNKK